MRHRNGKLYLLDFGAVKQVTKAAVGAGSSTGIYSMGFAPPEQMSGEKSIHPHLYALAVTAVMLLTGRGNRFDAYSNQWNWRSQVTVSDRLAVILDRMLLAAPSQRFQSAESNSSAHPSQTASHTSKSSATGSAFSKQQHTTAATTGRSTSRTTLELLTGAALWV